MSEHDPNIAYYAGTRPCDGTALFFMKMERGIDRMDEELFSALITVFDFKLISKAEFDMGISFKLAPIITQDDITFLLFEDLKIMVDGDFIGLVGVCTHTIGFL